MWDNRPKKASGQFSAKSPDFKCKDKACEGVIWPDRDAKPAAPQAKSVPPRAGRTWLDYDRMYHRALVIAYKHVSAAATKSKLPVTMADVVAAGATVFIAATRDGVQEIVTAPPAAPLNDPPPQLEEPSSDLPF